jgi:hypothetical protein
MKNWISVNDVLPRLGNPVLVYRSDGVIRITHFCKTGWFKPVTKAFRVYEKEGMKVTHWMPLPTPPIKQN